MNNAAEIGSASNVVRLPRRAVMRDNLKPAPHFIVSRNGHMEIDAQIDGLWCEAMPLLARILAEMPQTLSAMRAAVDAMLVLPVAVFNDDDLMTAAGLIHEGGLPGGLGAVYVLIEPDGAWPDLSRFLDYLDDLAQQQNKDCLVLWSPSPLPQLDGWHAIDIPGPENLRGLFRSIGGQQ